MEIFIGNLCGTHGIKGELKLRSVVSFDIKKNDIIYIENKKYQITSLRKHKDYLLISVNDMLDINLVFDLKNKSVYMKREDVIDDLIPEDLVEYEIMCDQRSYGVVKNIQEGKNLLLEISYENKKYYIPYYGDFILNIDKENKIIEVKDVKGLIL